MRSSNRTRHATALAATALLAASTTAAAQTSVLVRLPAQGFDMEQDVTRHRLYVSVPATHRIVSLPLAAGVQSQRLAGPDPHGIAISLDGSRLFVALRGEGAVAALDLDAPAVRYLDALAALGDSRTHDVVEGKPGHVFVSADPDSSGLSWIAMLNLDAGDSASRVASERIIRAGPVFAPSPDGQFLYVGEGFSPNSLYKLDLSSEQAPIVLEDQHGSVSGTQQLAVSPDGLEIYLGSGQVLQTSDFTQLGNVAAGIPRLNAAGTLAFVAQKLDPSATLSPVRVRVHDTTSFAQLQTIGLPCSVGQLRDFEIVGDGAGLLVLGDDLVCGLLPVVPHDLSVTLTDGAGPATLGGTLTLTASVSNAGTAAVSGGTATFTLPVGLDFVSSNPAAPACIHAEGSVTCALGTLAPGASTALEVTVSVHAVGTLMTSIAVAAAPADDNPLNDTASELTSVSTPACAERLVDGSFEAGSPNAYWSEYSLNYGTPLCTFFYCGTGGGTVGPLQGSWWAWFGGASGFEAASLQQAVLLPPGSATLRFYLWNGYSGGSQQDFFRATVDSSPVFDVFAGNPAYAAGYTPVSVDLSPYADGGAHLLSLESISYGQGVTNFSVDNVSIEACPPPNLSVSPSQVLEGDSGTSELVFDLALSKPSPHPITVPFTTRSLTASAGQDFLPQAGTLTLPAGATGATISVSVLPDLVYEGPETFALALGAANGAVLKAPSEVIGTILDDDGLGVSVADVAVTEPASDARMATFTVRLSAPSSVPVSVDYTTVDGTATVADADYVAASGILSFDPGMTTATLDVEVLADAELEGPESFGLELSNPTGAALSRGLATATISDRGFYSLTPCRLVDTRLSIGHLGGPALAAQQVRTFLLTGRCGIPASASAISVNLAATGSGAAGNLRLYPAGQATPAISSVNYSAGQTRSNNAVVALDVSGQLSVFAGQASGTVHLVLDVNGYFE